MRLLLLFFTLFSIFIFSHGKLYGQDLISDPNLLHWWIFDNTNFPTDTTDHGNNPFLLRSETPGNHPVQAQNSTIYPSGGYSAKFGTDTAFVTSSNSDITTPFSIAVWFNLPGGNPGANNKFIGVDDQGLLRQLNLLYHNSTQRFRFSAWKSLLSQDCYSNAVGTNLWNDFFDGDWHLIVAVDDGDSLYLYLDGLKDNSVAASGNADTPNRRIAVGYSDPANQANRNAYWQGHLEEIRVYSAALTPAQISDLWNNYQRVVTSNLQKRFKRFNRFSTFKKQ